MNEQMKQHLANGGGICGTCLSPAAATYENEGYSFCCNDRIEYDGEAAESIKSRREQEIAEAVEYAEQADAQAVAATTQDERENWQRIASERWGQVPA